MNGDSQVARRVLLGLAIALVSVVLGLRAASSTPALRSGPLPLAAGAGPRAAHTCPFAHPGHPTGALRCPYAGGGATRKEGTAVEPRPMAPARPNGALRCPRTRAVDPSDQV